MKHQGKRQNLLQVGFIMDVMEEVPDWIDDTSFSLFVETQKRGHHAYYIEPSDVFFQGNAVFANAREVVAFHQPRPGFKTLGHNLIRMDSLDVVFNRKEPPFDPSYLYLTQLLELLEPEVFVINSPRGVQKANEKLYILQFLKWAPRTIVTNRWERILKFQQDEIIDLILKPLDQKGGAGIRLLPRKSKDAPKILKEMTDSGAEWIMAQEFLKQNLTGGDKRILLLNGKVLGLFGRIPKPGEFRANLSLGGKHIHASLTTKDRVLIQALRPKLLRDGLYFVGLDVIDGMLLEINVTCPAGIPEINELEGTRLEAQVVDFLEERALKRSR